FTTSNARVRVCSSTAISTSTERRDSATRESSEFMDEGAWRSMEWPLPWPAGLSGGSRNSGHPYARSTQSPLFLNDDRGGALDPVGHPQFPAGRLSRVRPLRDKSSVGTEGGPCAWAHGIDQRLTQAHSLHSVQPNA